MARNYYDRYGDFKRNDKMTFIPFIKLTPKSTDLLVTWNKNRRLDKISNDQYGVPYYGWLIMLANPAYGGLEFDIPEGARLRVPYPLMDSLQDYQNKVEKFLRENGDN